MSVHPTQPTSSEITRPPVAIKGTKDGLLFILDDVCEFEPLYEHLANLFHGDTSNVFQGPEVYISVDFGKRRLTRDESVSIVQLFLEQENFLLKEWGPNTSARASLLQPRQKTQPQSVYKGIVRAGQRLLFEGDAVILGDINPGGEVVAVGDVYVFGKLAGTAHAGAAGNQQSIIAAAEFSPMQLRIASTVSRGPDAKDRSYQAFMEFAYLCDEGMAVDKMTYLAPMRAQMAHRS